MRWPMQTTRAPPRSQRASRVIAALQALATTFVMHAMVGRTARQLKMPRPDAYQLGPNPANIPYWRDVGGVEIVNAELGDYVQRFGAAVSARLASAVQSDVR